MKVIWVAGSSHAVTAFFNSNLLWAIVIALPVHGNSVMDKKYDIRWTDIVFLFYDCDGKVHICYFGCGCTVF